MAYGSGLRTGEITVVRQATAVIAADNPTLTDANILPADGVNCAGLDTVLVGVDITGGASPGMTIEALIYDENAADGSRWKRLLLGAAPGVTLAALANETTGSLVPGNLAELRVFGASKVYFRITAVANAGGTTAWKIFAMPGKVRGDRALNKKFTSTAP